LGIIRLMPDDSVTTTSSQSWFGRIGNAFSGILFGLVLFLGSFVLLAWNEGRAVDRAKTLQAGASQVITVPADKPDSANNGKLVHVTGFAEAEGPVSDPVFGISADGLKLRRDVEMYQWQEEKKTETKQKLGGGEETTTTYSYSKGWSPSLIDSGAFQKPDGHTNPDSLPVESETFVARGIHVGGFRLSPSLIGMIGDFAPRPATREEAEQAASEHSEKIQSTVGGGLFIGADPANPVVGDTRVTFQTVPSGPVSILAGQVGDTFEPFVVSKRGTIEVLKTGTLSASTMFQQEAEGNAMLTWILRLVGFFMMLFGMNLMANIFSVLASVIPFMGNIVGAGTGMLAFALAVPLTLLTIALAWLAYRPMIGIPLIFVAGGSMVFLFTRLLKSRKKA